MGLGDERRLFALGGPIGAGRLSTWTRDEPMALLLQRPEETARYLRTRFERLRGANALAVRSPRAVESTEDRAFDVVLFGLTPAAAAAARALRLGRLPFRVGRLPVAGEAQPRIPNHSTFRGGISPSSAFPTAFKCATVAVTWVPA